MGAGYGLASAGIFRMPGPLQRGLYGGAGQDVDPTAALIGNALQSFGSVRASRQAEADRQDALARQDASEAAMANWRDLQSGIALANAGLTTRPPDAPAATPVGAPAKTVPGAPSMPDLGGPAAGVDPSRVGGVAAPTAPTPTVQPSTTPSQPVSPLETVGGVSLYRAGPNAVEQRANDAEARTRTLHQRIGHALAPQILGHDVDDPTAEAIGADPSVFASYSKFQQTPPKNYSPVGGGAGAFDPSTGRVTPTNFTPPARGSLTTAQLTGQESRAAAQRLLTAATTTGGLEREDIGNAIPSTWASALGGIARIAGPGAQAGITASLRGAKTNQYQQSADQWVDAYLALAPKGRGGSSTEFRDRLKRMYFGAEGDTPANVQSKIQARQAATAALARAVATGVPPTSLPGFEPDVTPSP